MTTQDYITELLYRVDSDLNGVPKHSHTIAKWRRDVEISRLTYFDSFLATLDIYLAIFTYSTWGLALCYNMSYGSRGIGGGCLVGSNIATRSNDDG